MRSIWREGKRLVKQAAGGGSGQACTSTATLPWRKPGRRGRRLTRPCPLRGIAREPTKTARSTEWPVAARHLAWASVGSQSMRLVAPTIAGMAPPGLYPCGTSQTTQLLRGVRHTAGDAMCSRDGSVHICEGSGDSSGALKAAFGTRSWISSGGEKAIARFRLLKRTNGDQSSRGQHRAQRRQRASASMRWPARDRPA